MSILPIELADTAWSGRLEAAVRAAESAGAALLVLRGGDLASRDGRGGQLKTAADEAAEAWVLGLLRTQFSDDVFLCEERFEQQNEPWTPREAYWTVDALDGTRSYSEGYDGFCVQIAYVVEGRPRLGVVAEPAADRTYMAVTGAGAYRRDSGGTSRLALEQAGGWPARPIFVDSTRPDGAPGEWFRRHDARFLELGSIGLKICRVADGSAHVFLKSLQFKLWDVAPGEVILTEAGGRLGLWNGDPIRYDSEQIYFNDILAAPAPLAGPLAVEVGGAI